MDLYIYSDESGVFDYKHNKIYVYGGLIFTSKEEKENYTRKYLSAERNIAKSYPSGAELKASYISNKHKLKLFNATKDCVRFGAVIHEASVQKNIYDYKQSKQRYLDYVYKMALKNAFIGMKRDSLVRFEDINNLNIFVDEHTTATDGRYELREGLIQEFKIGTFNLNYSRHFPPIFPNLKDVKVQYCNSAKATLIRASDVIANRLYYLSINDIPIPEQRYLYIKNFP